MVLWNGKPITALDTSHIERILTAIKRGKWSDGKPCRVRLETARELRWELNRRGAGSFKPDTRKTSGEDVDPVKPPNYDAQLASMGYVPPPAPIPEPWSKPWKPPAAPSRYPSVTEESMDPKGAKLAEKLKAENDDLKAELLEATKAAAYMERRADRLAVAIERLKDEAQEQALATKRESREAQPMYRRLRGAERRAASDDLMDITEIELIGWWRAELDSCSGALVESIQRLLSLAGRGINVQTIKPRKLRRPGIQKD